MNWTARHHLLRIFFLAASIYLAVLSPAVSNVRTSQVNQHREASRRFIITTQPRPPCNDSMFEWLPQVLRLGGDLSLLVIPETRWLSAITVVGAAALAMHYDNERPYPKSCRPSAPDKWQHCYVGCKIATSFPLGAVSASALAILKEIRDEMNHGRFSWPDVFATLRGAWACTSCESCEDCCCGQVGGLIVPHHR